MYLLTKFYCRTSVNILQMCCSKKNHYNFRYINYRSCISQKLDVTYEMEKRKLHQKERNLKIKTIKNYIISVIFFVAGLGFAFVPVFNSFCSVKYLFILSLGKIIKINLDFKFLV